MKFRIKDEVKIREEDGFFLVVNLTTEDMLNGYPAFFKVNALGETTLRILKSYHSIEEIVDILSHYFPSVPRENIEKYNNSFVSLLKRYSLIDEVN